ncbi:MAG: dihydrofolate reductase [SAR86 cluster bacterium]|uniref:Dihydrofolate reductase n=1 Tax=SAR86 cluster bacterium TaxID=2030880 RepID=A0A2A4WW85_9GAMM|nr:MAG: dihydrofolate reductase [SAR86 cluster bacterium]
MKITYYCAMSSDEFIAREDGDVSWLDDMNSDESESSYDEFFASVDGLAMGRGTYDFIFNYGSWPYGDVPTWIFTSKSLIPLAGANLNLVKTVDDFILEANTKKVKHIWLVGGGKIASSFLQRGLLTHLSITEAPIQLNAGLPLFSDHKLENIKSIKNQSIQKQGCKQIEIVLRE